MGKQKTFQNYALISVFDKTDILDLAKIFVKKGIGIIATGGTAEYLQKNKIAIIPIEKITKSPESFDGRMKTISFQIASGILFDRKNSKHQKQAKELNISSIDFVVCNFYPFWEKPGIEMIDIGGPTMVRAAAKNYKSVTVLVDPNDYESISKELTKKSNSNEDLRKTLAAKAFSYVAEYDEMIANHFQNPRSSVILSDRRESKDLLQINLYNGEQLRYGENPHQNAMFFKDGEQNDTLSLGMFTALQGKDRSYSNYLDLDAGIQAMCLIGKTLPACVILKHTNPCGAAVTKTIEEAFQKAWFDGDPLAAFGGVIIFNRPVTKKLAENMLADKKFFEIIAAPEFSKEARELFKVKPKLQLLTNKKLEHPSLTPYIDIKKVRGGFLVQDTDISQINKKQLKYVTKKKPTAKQIDDLLFGWKLCQVSKSNCVVIVKDGVLLASGVGQQDRKRCCELCINKANKSVKGAVAATDGFFPFRDGPDFLINAGIKAIIQPGGSIRDQQTIDACDESKVAMIMTGIRAFKH